MQVINHVMEEEEKFNSEVYMAFFYYTNAFDSMEAKFVLEALKKDGVGR